MTSSSLIVLFALLAGGLAVWVEVIRRRLVGRPLFPDVPVEQPRWNPAVIIVAALLIILLVASRLMVGERSDPPSIPTVSGMQAGLIQKALIVAFLLMLLSELGQQPLPPYGIRLDRWADDLKFGTLGWLAALPPVYAVMWITQPLRSEDQAHGMVQLLQKAPSLEKYVWVAVSVIVVAPILEELLFRVILQGALRRRLRPELAIIVSSVAFALMHGFPDAYPLFPLAIVLGYVFERRRSYLAVVVLHALFNATTLALLMLSHE